jgi:CDGSH-type Zn-finger protein/uncharacterized Fe-S cluster protein YjdI
MKSRPRSYKGAGITVSYDARRCIHAAECVHGLPEVFDPERRPWIEPDGASPQQVAAVVRACPTGALKVEPAAGGQTEAVADKNTVTVVADGPLYLRGDLVFTGADGEELREARAALCRCGASSNKPWCDNSHQEAGFADPGAAADPKLAPREDEGERGSLRIAAAANGPLLVEGPMELCAASGEQVATGRKGALCRCGASANKPFCDGSHVAIGFEA